MDCGCFHTMSGSSFLFPQYRCQSSCDEFKDHRCQAHVISIYRKCDQAAESNFPSHVSQVNPQKCATWLRVTCILSFLLAFTFLMGTIGKENPTQDYDADILLPSKALWFFACTLFWFLWSLLHLLQMCLWGIKGLLWFLSISVSPLCHSLSFLLSCILLLLHYTCDAVYFATFCPVYVCGMFAVVCIPLYIVTRNFFIKRP